MDISPMDSSRKAFPQRTVPWTDIFQTNISQNLHLLKKEIFKVNLIFLIISRQISNKRINSELIKPFETP